MSPPQPHMKASYEGSYLPLSSGVFELVVA